jgi:lipopolysaccharide transport system ATP-binding protein
MALPIIEIEGLGKKYKIGANREKYLSLRDQLAKTTYGLLSHFRAKHQHVPSTEDFWALRDVSFSVKEGEAVGIIGRNGAGKSTLLKILSQITPPTEGKITCRGRIASLLEVGTGFHPELTGRENIYLNGAILGMTRAEIKRKFDEIVAFSEVEKFLDTPVKRYSSGMYVRLAFAVAAHLDPEILVIDEVLAVGDAEFQKKCLNKMGSVARQGRTVLFVSHNMGAVTELCSRGILLSQGKLLVDANASEVIGKYLSSGTGAGMIDLTGNVDERTGTGPMRLTKLATLGKSLETRSVFEFGEPLLVSIGVAGRVGKEFILGVSVRNNLGQIVLHFSNTDDRVKLHLVEDQASVSLTIPSLPLNDGKYFLTIWLGDGMNILNDRVGNCLSFIVDSTQQGQFKCQGLVRVPGEWKVSKAYS